MVVVSEENGQVSLIERARIIRNLNELQLARAIRGHLDPAADGTRRRIPGTHRVTSTPTLAGIGRFMRGTDAERRTIDGTPAARSVSTGGAGGVDEPARRISDDGVHGGLGPDMQVDESTLTPVIGDAGESVGTPGAER